MSSIYTDKETITRVEFLALERLLWLARRKKEQCHELIAEMRQLTGEAAKEPNNGFGGHSMDAVYEEYAAEELMNKLGIRVEDAPSPEPPQSPEPTA
jgi:hypothetical protein